MRLEGDLTLAKVRRILVGMLVRISVGVPRSICSLELSIDALEHHWYFDKRDNSVSSSRFGPERMLKIRNVRDGSLEFLAAG